MIKTDSTTRQEKLDEVLDYLNDKQMRATYGAVAKHLGVLPRSMGQILGDPSPRASWVVTTGGENMPTDYPAEEIHPNIKRTSLIIKSTDALERGLSVWKGETLTRTSAPV